MFALRAWIKISFILGCRQAWLPCHTLVSLVTQNADWGAMENADGA